MNEHDAAAVTGRRQVVALVGPTASGKTELGIELARRFDAEIINADSRQIYRGLEIGSAKPTAAQRARVPHHLLDVAAPEEVFDCARFRELAVAAIDDVTRRGKRALVVGGTGLYVRVLLHGVFEGPPRDEALRRHLAQQEAAERGALHRRLQQVDPRSAARLHPNDQVRLIRALEVYERSGRTISDWQAEHRFAACSFDSTVLALDVARPQLYARIDARCDAMLAAGLIDEVRSLLATGLAADAPALHSPGYREIVDHLQGRCDLATARQRMAQATRHLAKRQLTWFRHDRDTHWVAADLDAVVAALLARAPRWCREPEAH